MTVARGIYRGKIPKITWGASFANTLVFAQALDKATSYSTARDVMGRATGMNGAVDGWSYGTRGMLAGTVRRIPRVDTLGVTGWEGATGWDAWLASARDAQTFRFYPDTVGAPSTYWTCYLMVSDEMEAPDEEPTRHRMFVMHLWQTTQDVFIGY